MKTFTESVIRIALTSLLLPATFGCSAYLSDQTSAAARERAMEARANVADANARVTAAEAHAKVADADARADALANRQRGNTRKAKAVIPSGTLLKVFLIDAIASDTSSPGDRFLASLAESVVVNGATLLPKGTRVRGRVINAGGAGKMKGRARIHLELTDIVRGNSRAIVIKTRVYEATVAGNGVDRATKGNEIHYDPETRLDFTLTSPVDL